MCITFCLSIHLPLFSLLLAMDLGVELLGYVVMLFNFLRSLTFAFLHTEGLVKSARAFMAPNNDKQCGLGVRSLILQLNKLVIQKMSD